MRRSLISLLVLALFVPSLAFAEHHEVVEEVRRILGSKGVNASTSGVSVVDVETGEVIIAHNEGTRYTPASVMKIFTSAAALGHLSPEHTFKTKLYADSPINREGVIEGNLYLEAGGDPSMVPEQMFLFVQRLVEAGMKEFTGKLVLDLSAHEDRARPIGWPANQFHRAYAAPLGPLNYRYNSVSISVRGNGSPGQAPVVTLNPQVSSLVVRNKARIASRGGDRLGISVIEEKGKDVILISGTVAQNYTAQHLRSVNRPDLYFAHAFLDMLEKEGIRFAREVTLGNVPEGSKWITTHSSTHLEEIVEILNLYSNNIIADVLLRQLGAEHSGKAGSTARGIAAVESFLVELGLDPAGLDMTDGSGLSRSNDVTPALTTDLLTAMHNRFDIGPEFVKSLAVSGAVGTLRRRFEEPQYRQIRGKTGTVSGVISLAGYLRTESGKTLAYAIYLNGVTQTWNARRVTDKICIALCSL